MFVTLEGVDGAGKSTQARLLADALGPETLLLREPGGTPVGERLREVLKDGELELSPRSELLLFCAARAELVERVIKPALQADRDVVCDRFVDSTVAYQGARGLDPDLIAALNSAAVDGCWPDRTVLLRSDVGSAVGRTEERGGAAVRASDRFEREGPVFQEQVAATFDRIAAEEGDRLVVVDAAGTIEDVHTRVMEAIGR